MNSARRALGLADGEQWLGDATSGTYGPGVGGHLEALQAILWMTLGQHEHENTCSTLPAAAFLQNIN